MSTFEAFVIYSIDRLATAAALAQYREADHYRLTDEQYARIELATARSTMRRMRLYPFAVGPGEADALADRIADLEAEVARFDG